MKINIGKKVENTKYNFAYTKSSLSKMIKNSDYFRQRNLNKKDQEWISRAFSLSSSGYNANEKLEVTTRKMSKKNIYSLKNYWDKLLIRKVAKNISVAAKISQQDRDSITNNLCCLMCEGIKFRVYRLDLKDFYASIDKNIVYEEIENDDRISGTTKRLIKNILSEFDKKEVGLPRGLLLSSILAEYIMTPFDKFVENLSGVCFYSRFVDDMIILTDGEENQFRFTRLIEKNLFKGVKINHAKTYRQLVESYKPTIDPLTNHPKLVVDAKFNFLGYNFSVHNIIGNKRLVLVDMAKGKANKIKKRLVKSFLEFVDNLDQKLLEDRIKLLTGNFYIYDRDAKLNRTAGIYYSYKLINVDIQKGENAIADLNKFYKSILLAGKYGISKKIQSVLTLQQRKQLLKHSFVRGHIYRTFHHFNTTNLINILKGWKYD